MSHRSARSAPDRRSGRKRSPKLRVVLPLQARVRRGATHGFWMGTALAAMSCVALLLGGRALLDRVSYGLLAAPVAYVAGGALTGAAAGAADPLIDRPWRAYVAGVILGVPLALAVRLILRGAQPWSGADTFVMSVLPLTLGGACGVSFWRVNQRIPLRE